MKFKTRRRIRREALENAKKTEDIPESSVPEVEMKTTKEKSTVLPKKETKTVSKKK